MPGRSILISPAQVRTIIDRFETVYPRMGSPRLLVYVNRELVDDLAGMKLLPEKDKAGAARTNSVLNLDLNPKATPSAAEDSEYDYSTFSAASKSQLQALAIASEKRYPLRDHDIPTLADRQTAQEIERLFSRPFRSAGVRLNDTNAAKSLIVDSPVKSLLAPAPDQTAIKNRDALKKIADVVVEILVAPHHLPLPGSTDGRTYVVPDLQATALRLSDSKIVGQVASSDILGRVFTYTNRNFEMPEIAEITAPALMEEMTFQWR